MIEATIIEVAMYHDLHVSLDELSIRVVLDCVFLCCVTPLLIDDCCFRIDIDWDLLESIAFLLWPSNKGSV